MTIESDQNNAFPLTETSPGKYSSGILNLDITRNYRLRIKTKDNQQYLSDFVAVKVTPPIDSIGFDVLGTGIQIYANAHDPANNTRYYRWDYDETWQFHAQYESDYYSDGVSIVPRLPGQFTYGCFASDTSSSIVLGSSAKLKQDVIYQTPITTIASTSEKIETKYSIHLNQYALTSDAYSFWQNLKKNTEQLGSIFDAQPTNIAGNIHNTGNPAEPVIGYISACTVQTKRVFISNEQLPRSWIATYPYQCQLDSELFCHGKNCQNDVALFLIPQNSGLVPVYGIPIGSLAPIGYFSADIECTDCRLRGTQTTPPFWKY